jgi:hypothetical protein
MSFNPNLPANNSPVVAAELRNQFNALKALNDAVPASPAMLDVLAAQTAGSIADLPLPDFQVSDPPTRDEVLAIVNYLTDLHALLQRQ